ncbi:MAG: hypothetical protein KQH63_13415 [Desulfobulbaceae bacterium]|nr:hypothetical protein [Desulfobulbaceae bacterium]
MEIKTEINARKEPVEEAAAWELLSKNKKIFIARGKKTNMYTPSDDNRDEILKNALGRSGTLRAPTLLITDTCYVGFNEEMYGQLTGI